MRNIDIIMFATHHLSTYTQYAIPAWKQYCTTHNYKFIHYNKPYFENLHLVWSKICSVREHLYNSSCEYLLMVDADTIPTSLEVKIEAIIETFMLGEKQILFQKDGSNRLKYLYFTHNFKLSFNSSRWILPNAGFILIKNTNQTKALLDEWLERAKTSKYANVPPRNQNVLVHELMTQPKYDNIIGYVETWVVNKFKGKLCQHFSSKTPQQIAECMLPFYNKIMR